MSVAAPTWFADTNTSSGERGETTSTFAAGEFDRPTAPPTRRSGSVVLSSSIQCTPASKDTNISGPSDRSPSAYTTGGDRAPSIVVATATWLTDWNCPAPIGITFVNVAPPSWLAASAVPPAAYTKFAVPGAHTSWPAVGNCGLPAEPGNRWTSDQVRPRSLSAIRRCRPFRGRSA